jgi:hypothetical protein
MTRDQNDYHNVGGETIKNFFRTIIHIFNSAFMSGYTPSGIHLSSMQALEWAIEHEFGHAYGGCMGGASLGADEACADAYANKQLGY